MQEAKISIIVPIYKVEKELERCIQSIQQQSYRNLEILLVDDGSPDKCPEICDAFARKDNRIQVIHKENGGLSDARNCGLCVSTGEYILYVDSDDYIELDACEQLMSVMDSDIDFVIGACREIRGKERRYQRHSNIQEGEKYAAKEFVIQSIKVNEWYAPAWLCLYRRKFLLDNSLFFKKGYYYEDMEMLIRLFLAAEKVVYKDYCFYNYVIRDGSIMTSDNTTKKREMAVDIYKNWKRLIDNVNDEEYQKFLYGILIKYYLHSCRMHKVTIWEIEGLSLKFAWKYALNKKEKMKVLFFSFFPKLYIKKIRLLK